MTPFHFLLANQSLSLQIGPPNKKARLYVHRAFVHEIPVFFGGSDPNNSQISLLLEAAGVYHTLDFCMVLGCEGRIVEIT